MTFRDLPDFEAAFAELRPTIDAHRLKGMTTREWAEHYGKCDSAIRPKLRAAVGKGLWVRDMDWRLFEDGKMRQVPVYRPKEGYDGIP